jgi:hypothetical protein
MRLSDDKVTHMSHVLLKGLLEKDTIDITEDDGKVRHAIRRAITHQLKLGDQIEKTVVTKIESLSRGVSEGSAEWDILYKQYYEEEERKHGLGE